MTRNLLISGLMALALSALTVNACKPTVSGVVSCPNGNSTAGIHLVVLTGPGNYLETWTEQNGAFFIDLPPGVEGTYTIYVDPYSLVGTGYSVAGKDWAKFTVSEKDWFADINFTLQGAPCEEELPPGPCWLTGGGTFSKSKGTPEYSFGGVVNPGCSPTAAGGGNWNVVNHAENLHFKGLDITVIQCSGVPTKSPKVNVNVIDFMGTGILVGINGNPTPLTAVQFIARAIDNSEPGAGKDALYLNVIDTVTQNTLLLISADPATQAPLTLSTGNLQIHTSSCEKRLSPDTSSAN